MVFPIVQLVTFLVVAWFGLRLYHRVMSDMAELIDKLGVAFIEDRQTYRMLGELVKAERENARTDG